MNEGTISGLPRGDAPLPGEPQPAADDAQPAPGEGGVNEAVPPVKKQPNRKTPHPPGWMRSGKFRPGMKMRAAITEVVARVAAGWGPGYKEVSERHTVNPTSLASLYYRYKAGGVDLEPPQEIEAKVVAKKEISLQAELMRREALLARYEKHLDDTFSELLAKAELERKDGNLLAFDQLGIPKVLAQMGSANGVRRKLEKGVLDIMEAIQATADRRKQMAEPQLAKGTVVIERPTQAGHVRAATSEQQKIRELLATQPVPQ